MKIDDAELSKRLVAVTRLLQDATGTEEWRSAVHAEVQAIRNLVCPVGHHDDPL